MRCEVGSVRPRYLLCIIHGRKQSFPAEVISWRWFGKEQGIEQEVARDHKRECIPCINPTGGAESSLAGRFGGGGDDYGAHG